MYLRDDCASRSQGSRFRHAAQMTVVLGEPLFPSDFYCPLRHSVYRALLLAWQERHARRGWRVSVALLQILPGAQPPAHVLVCC